MSFDKLGLSESLVRAVEARGYDSATPIQREAIPVVITGRDLMACAQTGTGKTAAFALPMLERLCLDGGRSCADGSQNGDGRGRRDDRNRRVRRNERHIRALVLAPTRELAVQIGSSIATYGKFTGMRSTVVYGGVGQGTQVRALESGVDILVATPGRLLDLMEQGFVDLRRVEILVLDEADQMLDMGFIVPLRRIVATIPRERQTLMFSATMPPEIRNLANEWLRDPAFVQVGRVASPVELVEQSVYHVEPRHKPQLLAHYLRHRATGRSLVFARTKHGADKLVRHLTKQGIRAAAIHGNKSQSVRQRTLEAFKSDRPPVLVATDIAARGLDVQGISHVINYELPDVAEVYVHRIGRTGRAGAAGIATSFCARDERDQLRQIERLTRRTIDVSQDQPKYSVEAAGKVAAASKDEQPSKNNRRPAQAQARGKSSRRRGNGQPAAWSQGKQRTRRRRRAARV
jgi:ATP-dependent RNA helicase RhlE